VIEGRREFYAYPLIAIEFLLYLAWIGGLQVKIMLVIKLTPNGILEVLGSV
jgi:hypothetical protein